MNEEKIREILVPVLEEHNALLIDLKLGRIKGSTLIHIWIDKEIFLTVDDCYKISRQVEKKMVELNIWDERTSIEVSSPGTDKPLKFIEQYKKHINRKFKIKYKSGDEIITSELVLRDIKDNILYFGEDNFGLDFNNIIEAKVIISFK